MIFAKLEAAVEQRTRKKEFWRSYMKLKGKKQIRGLIKNIIVVYECGDCEGVH